MDSINEAYHKITNKLNSESIFESNITTIVIADKKTGSIWGGVWPEDNKEDKLKRVQKETKNKNYAIMSFSDAMAIEKKYKSN